MRTSTARRCQRLCAGSLIGERANRTGNRARAIKLLDLLTVGLNGRANERAFGQGHPHLPRRPPRPAAAQAAPARRPRGRAVAVHLKLTQDPRPAATHDLAIRVMVKHRRARDDDVRALPRPMLTKEWHLLAFPLVPERDIAAVSCDAARPGVDGIRLHPHESVNQARQLSASGTHALHHHGSAASEDLNRTLSPALDPGWRSVGDPLASANGRKHAAPHEVGPAEERVVPGNVVRANDGNARDDFSQTRREGRLPRPAAPVDGDDGRRRTRCARCRQREQFRADIT